MTGTEVHEAWAAAALDAWEDLCADDPDAEKMEEAAENLEKALKLITDAIDELGLAEGTLYGTPMEQKVAEFMARLDDIYDEVRYMQEHYAEGVRE
ncbi:MAG: hypothetical protein J6P40_07335 [Oscillospiraceae bacterium]|nr:hypothetical protein [Oscillospiraceae bacterium]